jgi:transcriptional regulator with XRE-family HTH domain
MSGRRGWRREIRPRRTQVNFKGVDHWMDVLVCEHALVRRQVEGDFETLRDVAMAANVSRSTVSRFLSGRPTSLRLTLRILAELKLTFDEVFTRCEVADDELHRDGQAVVAESEPRPLDAGPGGR